MRFKKGHPKAVAMYSILAILLLLPVQASAQTADPEKTAAEMINPAAQRAIDQGLQWLSSRQNDDGGFGQGVQRGNAAICGLCGMAFMSGGSTPGRGPYGDRVERAVDYLLANAQPSGYIIEPTPTTHGPMYSHGFATLFLAECYGMSKRTELRDKLSLAVKLIINSQNKEGGWRYYPKKDDADISVTVCQVMALRAAHNAGIHVPKETIDRAVDYVKRCQNRDGGFLYMLSGGGESSFPRSAAGIVALNSAGIYKGAEITSGLDYLTQFRPEQGVTRREQYYEYGHYYAVQALWQAGGERWARWYPAIRDELISHQGPDGSWSSTYGSEYSTAMCLIILQMPENQLPIFQR
ncbi:MAG: prenyltransferase/squalene oxidase repeat-containing protein [Planctomycetota bacterium]